AAPMCRSNRSRKPPNSRFPFAGAASARPEQFERGDGMPSPLFRIRPDASPRRLARIMTPPMAQGMKPPLEPTIATARLLLRPPLEADIPAFAAGLDEIEVVRMLARVPFPYSLEDGRDFLASARDSARWGTDVNLVITHQDEILGCIGLADIPAINELGHWLGRP